MSMAIGIGLRLEGGADGGSAFTPASLTPTVWLDPSDLTTMRQTGTRAAPGAAAAVDSPVGLIMDKSGNQYDFVQATASARPILRNSGSTYWLEFDGVDDAMATAAAVTMTGSLASMALALRMTNTALSIVLESSTLSTNNPGAFYVSANDVAGKYLVSGTGGGAGVDQVISAGTYASTDAVVDALFDFSQTTPTTKIQARADGGSAFASSLDQADTSTTLSSQVLYLGARNGVSFPFTGRFHGGLILNRTATTTERANILTYLGGKQGRAL